MSTYPRKLFYNFIGIIIFCSIFLILNATLAFLVGLLIYIISPRFILYFNSPIEKYELIRSERYYDFIEKLPGRVSSDEIILIKSKSSRWGYSQHVIGSKNIIGIPSGQIEKTRDKNVKSIIAHEYAHINNLDGLKYSVFKFISNYLISFVIYMGLSYSWYLFILLGSGLVLVNPIIANYLIHKSEYKADRYSMNNVGYYPTINRIREDTGHIEPDDSLFSKYLYSYPSDKMRMDRLSNCK